jgi:hypothetical protein
VGQNSYAPNISIQTLTLASIHLLRQGKPQWPQGIFSEMEPRKIVSRRTAELILEGIQDADLIIFDDQIRRRRIDPDTGEIS